ncbi:hypothetical protein D3C80_1254680 [compost metagenome]
MSLETMVDSATLATITMPVAAEAPPIKASRASAGCDSANGRLITNESGSTELGSSICPARAIGTTNNPARIRYAGNTQRARRKSWGSMFSTTVTWNCRGRQMIAIMATPVCTTIDGQLMVSCQ